MRKKGKRDTQATEKTKAYFLSRDGKPTSIAQAAKDLKVPPTRLHTRVANLTSEKFLTRVDRGVYVATTALPQPVKIDTDNELLSALLKEREHLDAQIEKVREVIELKKKRGGK